MDRRKMMGAGWFWSALAVLAVQGAWAQKPSRAADKPLKPAQVKLDAVPAPPKSAPPQLKVGDMAPDLRLTTPDGKAITLSEIARDRVVLVQFMFMASDFCRLELLSLQKAHQRFKDKGLVVLSVDTGSRATDRSCADYWKVNGLTYQVVMNGSGADDASKVCGVTNWPDMLLIGRDRRVLARWAGFSPRAGAGKLFAELAKAGFK